MPNPKSRWNSALGMTLFGVFCCTDKARPVVATPQTTDSAPRDAAPDESVGVANTTRTDFFTVLHDSLQLLRERFNAERDRRRILALLSPV